nr:zinc finger, CCHC-type, retrotransposon Gag domain protein [Tanacetum cinerariifolium]
MVSEPGYETVGSKDLTCEDWMVNIRTDADLSVAVQNALQTLLPQIRVEIREEFHFKKLFFLQLFPRSEQERLKREYYSIRQTNTKTSTEFMQR